MHVRKMTWVMTLIVVLGTASCTTSERSQPPTAGVTSPATGGVIASRQSADEAERTLASLRRLDPLPMYEMTYVGDYDELAGVAVASSSPFGCSLFVASGEPSRPVFGRNFDWQVSPGLVLHTDPPDGYASVSFVDIGYLGVAMSDDLVTDNAGRRKLLNAPLLPFDGMNERGLAIGLAADESGRVRTDPGKPTVSGVRIIRLILDHAGTVNEAIGILRRHNLDFSGGPPLHYLLADASGASAVIEFVDGRMEVVPGGPRWQALTNFRLAGSDAATRQGDRRYRTAAAALDRTAGAVDWRQAMEILQDVAQPSTRWSVTYELRTGVVHLVPGQRWGVVHEFRLTMRL